MQLIKAVKEYALAHYNDAGARWDIVIECWEDSDILRIVLPATSESQAIDWVRDYLKPISSVYAEHEAEAMAGGRDDMYVESPVYRHSETCFRNMQYGCDCSCTPYRVDNIPVSRQEKGECNNCGGYGSLESCDPHEQTHGIRDTCYRCNGTGYIS